MTKKLIYFDNASTTKVCEKVIISMNNIMKNNYANTTSVNYLDGKVSENILEITRKNISNFIGCNEEEIFFNSGATEGINNFFKGLSEYYKEKKIHVICSSIEHYAVIDTLEYLKNKNIEVTYITPVNSKEFFVKEVKQNIKPNTIAICCMLVNNETGDVFPVDELCKVARENNLIMFSDLTQAIGKIPVCVKKIDVAVFSAHKIYGPKGTGAIHIKKNIQNKIVPLLHGGGQEKKIRSGTVNLPSIVGFYEALKNEDKGKIKDINQIITNSIIKNGFKINTFFNNRVNNIINISIKSKKNNVIITELLKKKFAYSRGSSCSTKNNEPSHVLKELGLNKIEAKNSIRISFSKYNTIEEANIFCSILEKSQNSI